MVKQPVFIVGLIFVLGAITLGCSPPVAPPAKEAKDRPKVADLASPAQAPTAVFPPVSVERAPKPERKELDPAVLAGHWLVVNVGETWSAPFMAEVATGLPNQKALDRAGLRVVHACVESDATEEVHILPQAWKSLLPDRRSVPMRILISPEGTIQQSWLGHVDGETILQALARIIHH